MLQAHPRNREETTHWMHNINYNIVNIPLFIQNCMHMGFKEIQFQIKVHVHITKRLAKLTKGHLGATCARTLRSTFDRGIHGRVDICESGFLCIDL